LEGYLEKSNDNKNSKREKITMDLHESFEAQKKIQDDLDYWKAIVDRQSEPLTKPVMINDRVVFDRDKDTYEIIKTSGDY
jgi:hypothetical protein